MIRYRITVWDSDKQDWCAGAGLRRKPYDRNEVRDEVRRLEAMGYDRDVSIRVDRVRAKKGSE